MAVEVSFDGTRATSRNRGTVVGVEGREGGVDGESSAGRSKSVGSTSRGGDVDVHKAGHQCRGCW